MHSALLVADNVQTCVASGRQTQLSENTGSSMSEQRGVTACRPSIDAIIKASTSVMSDVVLQGKYGFKLLAVDVPTATGREQRLFIDGNDQGYTRGGFMSELRDPFLRVNAASL